MHEDNKYGCQPHFDDTCLLHLLQRLFIKIHDPRESSARNSRDISLWPVTMIGGSFEKFANIM